jgi:hypothetical protein
MYGDMVMEKMRGLKYWRMMKTKIMNKNKNSDPEDWVLRFCTLMKKLHSCCATSAGIERIFSVFGLIVIGVNVVKVVPKVKNLGFFVNERLTGTDHFRKVCQSVYWILRFLRFERDLFCRRSFCPISVMGALVLLLLIPHCRGDLGLY